ncbi:pentapeptide repeat-containing protein [Nostoc sp. NIES-4103]|nr:pentapeptide repeat-containing protein [Nostoc sp. NIES-4103]
MSENNTDTQRNSLIFIISFTVFALFIISSVVVAWFIWRISDLNELLKNETEALKTTATIFGGIAVFINAYYAAKRWEAMDKSAFAALKNAEAAQDKQITERFAKAIEQLGSDKIEVRLGAIYTLERIAKDSKDDHWTIMEVLTAFVRENAPVKDFSEKNTVNTESLIIVNSWNYKKPKEIEEKRKLQTDIQAALTVIGRRNTDTEQENQRLDLHNIDIRGADLSKANLQGAFLNEAKLQRADLTQAELQEAFVWQVNLQEANLSQANLQGVYLWKAELQGADLSEVNLQDAGFSNDNLQGVYLWKANLQGAKLWKVNLQGADLSQANLQWADLRGANLQGSDLRGANLQGADLSKAENLEQQQIELAQGDEKTELPENLQRPEHWQ